MDATPALNQNPVLKPSQKRLYNQHDQLHSWEAVANLYGVNWRYVWQHAKTGKVFRNHTINRKLRIKTRTINDHMAHDNIQDMPTAILRLAFEHRVEMQ